MKSFISNVVISLVFVFSISSIFSFLPQTQSLSNNANNDDLIKQTCQKTPIPTLCESTLRYDRRSSGANLKTLALIMVNAVDLKAKQILWYLNILLKSSQTQLEILNSCVDKYNLVVFGDVPEAIQGLRKKKYKFAQHWMRDAADEAEFCEKDFDKVGKSPITSLNNGARDLANVTVSIISMVS